MFIPCLGEARVGYILTHHTCGRYVPSSSMPCTCIHQTICERVPPSHLPSCSPLSDGPFGRTAYSPTSLLYIYKPHDDVSAGHRWVLGCVGGVGWEEVDIVDFSSPLSRTLRQRYYPHSIHDWSSPYPHHKEWHHREHHENRRNITYASLPSRHNNFARVGAINVGDRERV
jgi:hypothetical protein